MKLLAILAILVAGAALAAPAPVLRIASADRSTELPLPGTGCFAYSYRQSIYRVAVVEEQRAAGDHLEVLRVRSTDRRAVEYFRWAGEPRIEGDEVVQDAPDVRTDALTIRVTADAAQRLSADGRSVDLARYFGETVVRVLPASVPRAYWFVLELR